MGSHRFSLVAAVVLVATTACSQAPHHTGGDEPGGGTEARTVDVRALDTLRFDPELIEVEAGETILFVISNVGELEHEFVLGDEETQSAHGGGEHGEHTDALADVRVAPGEQKQSRVTFSAAGDLIFGCHLPGHYEGGMAGTVRVV